MGGRTILALFAAASLAATLPVAAQTGGFVTTVAQGSSEVGQRVEHVGIGFGYVNANGNGAVDLEEPDEPVYVDVDASNSVTFGDIRLAPFLDYQSGSQVDVSNRDFDLKLETAPGWIARTDSGALFFDLDRSDTVSVGDIRFDGDGFKVRPGDSGLGSGLDTLQRTVSSSLRVAWNDLNGNDRRDLDEPFYLDLDGDGTIDIGDVRIQGQGLVVEDPVEQSDINDLEARLGADQDGDGDGGDGGTTIAAAGGGGTPAWLVLLVIVNLIAVAVVGWKAFQQKP